MERDNSSGSGEDCNLDSSATQAHADMTQSYSTVPVLSAEETAFWFPGLRTEVGRDSRGPDDILGVIGLLNNANIPTCIVGVNALRYYGAGRITSEWDVCVPTQELGKAVAIFREDDRYEPAKPPPPLTESFRHLNPIFRLKDAMFFFILTPSSQWFIDPRPEYCEMSKTGIPYPRMPQFARSLLLLQNGSDLADFVDGMDLDERWGEENINFDDLQLRGVEFTKAQNAELEAMDLGQFNINVDYRRKWNQVVDNKERRIEPIKKGRYKTTWRRIKNDIDPRQRDRPF